MAIDHLSLMIPSGELMLEAESHVPADLSPAGILVVCHPHPLYGGSMQNNVVFALCESALQEGMAALRFNFRGVGASGGRHDGGNGERDDVRAALTAAKDLPGGDRIALAGYSFGAAMAARGSCSGGTALRVLILVSPPLRSIADASLEGCPAERLLLTGDLDTVCPAPDLETFAARMTPKPTCSIVEGADHSWVGYEDQLRDIAGSFLRWRLAGM